MILTQVFYCLLTISRISNLTCCLIDFVWIKLFSDFKSLCRVVWIKKKKKKHTKKTHVHTKFRYFIVILKHRNKPVLTCYETFKSCSSLNKQANLSRPDICRIIHSLWCPKFITGFNSRAENLKLLYTHILFSIYCST